MDTNLDIDRISLEDRIKALEARQPGGGGGGGTGLNTNLYIDPAAVEQCPENSVTDVGNGLIVRIDIDDVGAAPIVPGYGRNHIDFGLKAAAFFPKVNGLYYSCTSALMRVNVLKTSRLMTLPGANSSYIRLDFDVSLIEDLYNSLLLPGRDPQKNMHLWFNFGLMPFISFQGDYSTSPFAANFGGMILFIGTTPCLLINSTQNNPNDSVPQCCCFGTGLFNFRPFHSNQPPIHIFGGAVGAVSGQSTYGSFVGNTPQDLPQAIKSVYPASWYA